MSSQFNKITEFITSFPNSAHYIIDISSGVVVKRIFEKDKIKFKPEDANFLPKDYLNLKYLCKRKYPETLNKNFEPKKELTFLYVSPNHAHHVKDFREDLFLISVGDEIISTEYNHLKNISFLDDLKKVGDDYNYLVIITENGKIIDKKVFYCSNHYDFIFALKNATFGNFLKIVKEEDIKNENMLITHLVKEGVPLTIQDKYIEFWDDYMDFMDIVDELCYYIERKDGYDLSFLRNQKNLKKALIDYLYYDIEKAKKLLNDISDM